MASSGGRERGREQEGATLSGMIYRVGGKWKRKQIQGGRGHFEWNDLLGWRGARRGQFGWNDIFHG